MNLLNFRKLRDVATLTTAIIATSSVAVTNPTLAAVIQINFCGPFINDRIVSGSTRLIRDGVDPVVDGMGPIVVTPGTPRPDPPSIPGVSGSLGGFIQLDTDLLHDPSANFGFVDAEIETTLMGQPNLIYDDSDLFASGTGTELTGSDPGVVPGEFSQGLSGFWRFNLDGNDQNFFNLVIAKEFLNGLKDGSIVIGDQFPMLDSSAVDEVSVPEPNGVLGTLIAAGLGLLLTKKNLGKLNKKEEAA